MGWPAQNGKTKNSKFYDFRIIGYQKGHFNKLNKFVLPQFFVLEFFIPFNPQIIKSRISRFVTFSWSPHLPIILLSR